MLADDAAQRQTEGQSDTAPAQAAPSTPGQSTTSSKTSMGCMEFVVIGLIVVAVLFGVGVCAQGGSDSAGGGDEDVEVDRALAFDACKDFVKQRLKAPSTAKFPDYWDRDGEVTVTSTGTTYTVTSHVDAENSFGAALTNPFVCTVVDNGDRWTLEDLSM